MRVKTLPLGPLQTNCYVIFNDTDALIVDPGGEANKLIQWLDQMKLKSSAILLTHAHFDHIGAVDDVRDYYNIPVYVHKEEQDWLSDATLNGSTLFPVDVVTAREPDKVLTVGEMKIADFSFEIRHTPGHSPGGVIFIFHDEKVIIGGDSLFQSGIGRTDLPGGNYHQLIESIQKEMFSLGDAFTVYPSHGPTTTIGEEKENNPFL